MNLSTAGVIMPYYIDPLKNLDGSLPDVFRFSAASTSASDGDCEGIGDDCAVSLSGAGGTVAVGEEVEIPISAAPQPPSAGACCQLNPATFSFSVSGVEFRSTPEEEWGSGSASLRVVQADSQAASAVLVGSFAKAGYYRVQAQVTATWSGTDASTDCSDCPACGNCSAVASTTLEMMVTCSGVLLLDNKLVGWEDFPVWGALLLVNSSGQSISSLEFDFNLDGQTDYSSGYSAEIREDGTELVFIDNVLLEDTFGNPPQKGTYPGRVIIHLSGGSSCNFEITTVIGEAPSTSIGNNLPQAFYDILFLATPNENNYRQNFIDATPSISELEGTFEVHHTKPKRYAARFLAELGINIHETPYLVAYPNEAHKDLESLINKWEHSLVDPAKPGFERIEYVRDNVPLETVEKKMQEIMELAELKQYEIPPGASVNKVRAVNKSLKNLPKLITTRISRLQKIGVAVGIIGLLGFIESKVRAAALIAHPGAAARSSWESLHQAYENAIEFKLQNNFVRADHLQKIVDAFVAYGKAINLDGDALTISEAALRYKIDTREVW